MEQTYTGYICYLIWFEVLTEHTVMFNCQQLLSERESKNELLNVLDKAKRRDRGKSKSTEINTPSSILLMK